MMMMSSYLIRLSLLVSVLDKGKMAGAGWMHGWMDNAILRSFQEYFCHIRTIGG